MVITDNDVDFLSFIGEQESQEVRSPAEYKTDISSLITKGDVQSGESLPWRKVDEIQKLRSGELSIWGGVNGHGKSLLLGQVILNRLSNQRAIIASLEMKPSQTLYRMLCQYAGCRPSEHFANQILDKMENRLWIYDQLDSVATDRILGMVHWAAHVKGVHHVVIDSLIKCGLGREDYTAQAKFVDRLQWAAKSFGIHIHLVCHMRKKENEQQRAGKFDIRGASEIVDLADNLFIVHRNKMKEKEKAKKEKNLTYDVEIITQPDVYLAIEKNRHGGKEHVFGLWFHEDSMQYLPSEFDPHRGVLPAPF